MLVPHSTAAGSKAASARSTGQHQKSVEHSKEGPGMGRRPRRHQQAKQREPPTLNAAFKIPDTVGEKQVITKKATGASAILANFKSIMGLRKYYFRRVIFQILKD